MGTHPIFESDFDCLTDKSYFGPGGTLGHNRDQMLRFLRRTFSRRDRNRPQQNVKPVRPSSQHIPAPPKCRDTITCHVVLLDGSDITVDVPRQEKGEYLFRKIVMQLDLVEEDYF